MWTSLLTIKVHQDVVFLLKTGYSILTGNNWFLLEDKAKCETVIFYFPKQDRKELFKIVSQFLSDWKRLLLKWGEAV